MSDSLDTSDNFAPDAHHPSAKGAAIIAAYVKTLPDTPGVYRMFDHNGDVLYVGKAKSLKNRVTSYTRLTGQNNRILRMISFTKAMEFVTTQTETEALLLEANLIKRLKPRYNVLLRDDKSFPYILISREHPAPALLKHRGGRTQKGDYFGPFAAMGAVSRTLNALQKLFLLRNCSDSVYAARTRPCLQYQIKRCAAPCTQEISLEAYAQLADEAKAFLSGRASQVRTHLVSAMEQAAERLDYEMAAIYRDRLQAFATITSSQGLDPREVDEADVFAAWQEGGQTCVEVFFFRNYQNWGNRAYFPRADKSLSCEEVLGAFIAQFYDDKPCPKRVLVSHDLQETSLLAQALSSSSPHRVEVSAPKRGEKKELVDHALSNAREALARHLSDKATTGKLLEALGQMLGMAAAPRRIEVYDNSHIQGAHAVGAMIVAGETGFMKAHYRKWTIKEPAQAGDDFAYMREVFQRRFSRLVQETSREQETSEKKEFSIEEPESGDKEPPLWPDLVIVDGGEGQLNAARAIMTDLGIETRVFMIGVAKGPDRDAGRERFFLPDRAPFQLEPRDPVLYFVQRLRDEAHRFAIGTHRAKRSKAIRQTSLDEVPGIGSKRKRALLHHFGSAKGVARANVEDLCAVEGINETMARQILAFLNEHS